MLFAVSSSACAGLFMAPENREQEIANLLSGVHYNLDNCRVVSVFGLWHLVGHLSCICDITTT